MTQNETRNIKLDVPNCPECGELAIGTLESLTATARFKKVRDDGCTRRSGYTQVHWDSQSTNICLSGYPILLCRNGHDWPSEIQEL